MGTFHEVPEGVPLWGKRSHFGPALRISHRLDTVPYWAWCEKIILIPGQKVRRKSSHQEQP